MTRDRLQAQEAIVRVFPRRTSMTPVDDYAFVGDPPMIRPHAGEVHVSCVFTWDVPAAKRLAHAWGQYYPTVRLGGPALGSPANGFVPGRYVRPGVTFTSRGCYNHCPWCLVPRTEGKLRELPILAGHIVQDNNLLQCSRRHLEAVFAMLRTQRRVQLPGGLDVRLLHDWIIEELRSCHLHQLFLACDTAQSLARLRAAVRRLSLPRDQVRCYVLIAFDPSETVSDAEQRLIEVYQAGCLPFAQLYQPPGGYINYPSPWRQLARTWSRPALMKAAMTARKGVA